MRVRPILALCLAALAAPGLAAEPRPPPRGHPVLPPAAAPTDGGAPASPGARYLESLPPAAREALLRNGQVILDTRTSGPGPSLVKAAVRFSRSRADTYALITQPADQHTFLPHVEVSRPFGERTELGEREDFEVSFLFTFKYRTQHWFYPEEDRVEWNLDPTGGDGLEAQLGYWQLYELDEHTTLAEYGTHIVARGAILNFFRSLGERGAIDEALTAFRKHIDGSPKVAGRPAAPEPAVPAAAP